MATLDNILNAMDAEIKAIKISLLRLEANFLELKKQNIDNTSIFEKSVDEILELSTWTGNRLRMDHIFTIGDLVVLKDYELMKIKHFGKKSLQEIKDKLANINLYLGMHIKQE